MASPITWGSVFPVNSTIKSDQFDPKIYALKDGSFVAVWTDDSETETDINTAIRGQLFNADGSKKGGEFLINTTTDGYQDHPVVTVLNDGRFVVAWESSDGYVRARAYQANGTAIGNDFTVSSTGDDHNVAITSLSNGGFAISYLGGDFNAHCQGFDANLQASGTEGIIEDFGGNRGIVGLQGQYIAFSDNFAGPQATIRGQVRNNDGSLSAGSTTFDISTTGDQNHYAVAGKLADGRIIMVWTSQTYSETGPSLWQIKGQILNADGTKSGGELLLSAPGLVSSKGAAVTALADGGFAISYSNTLADRNSADIHVSAFDGNGVHVGADTILGRAYLGTWFYASSFPALDITKLADGRLAVTWSNWGSDWDDSGLYVQGQIVDLRRSGVNLTGTAADDRYYGSKFNDVMMGKAGNDVLFGGAGNDAISGGSGKDTFVFNTGLNSKSNKDKILDWNYRDDTIQLENAIFKKLTHTGVLNKAYFVVSAVAKDANDFVGYNSKTGDLWYDANGNAAGGQVAFANIGAHKTITSLDLYVI